MKMREIVESASAGATSAGSVATVSQPLGELQQRRLLPNTGKYMNSAPRQIGKSHAGR